MKKKAIRVYLRPEEMTGCKLECIEKSVKRTISETVEFSRFDVIVTYFGIYRILNEFLFDDFVYVREQYRLDPKMKKAMYYITLIPV